MKAFHAVIPWPGKPKARPRFNKEQGRAHMPTDYMDWKKQVAEFLATIDHPGFGDSNVKVQVSFDENEVHVIVMEIPIVQLQRAKGVTADIDNLVGGIMDALQDGGVVDDDKNVTSLEAWIVARSESV